MDRKSALVLTIIFFIVFFLVAYYGTKITFSSSLVFSTFMSLILLNLLYPLNQITSESADFTLILYALLQLIGIMILSFYIVFTTLSNVRC